MRLLITGATGKVGHHVLDALAIDPRYRGAAIRALVHSRPLDRPGIETVTGSLSDAAGVARAMEGVTHVLHMAAVKESPDLAMEVGVKGMFHLLEAFRHEGAPGRFLLLGGDCSVGHMFHAYPGPITEDSPRRAYPGCYALTKVLEEVMLEQARIQYGLDTCCLRAPWIVEKDDFRHALSFTDQFGGPAWEEVMDADALAAARARPSVPVLLDHQGAPLKRNFVHVSDLVAAILTALVHPAAEGELFNIAMDEPVDYAAVGDILAEQNFVPVEVRGPWHSNWLSNAKARLRLGWRPRVDLREMIERAFAYERAADDPRKVWYPG
ncbi:NAD-dependent epimerase/dehydratase family protein [Wenxinia marina]|uniref:Nucleoside-diphosphate-sugar epimerase n=1 Tax=Wenxinia marina DSM 24838 TaxID=1123501 RepID=A0A0D0Q8A4_9RHOB|nr:NAD(P)-dependent oxidoreductase [Wenxinia marina]KIQ68632.1 Nucleoside-diphosphate-sugar epimerase [Wenxinia marina DSM 24838]GGL67467.1 UDP-glucose 4-epimerase [Wenxinia marina]